MLKRATHFRSHTILKLNRLVWRFSSVTRHFNFVLLTLKLVLLFSLARMIFLDSSKCERFKICQFESNGAQAQADSVIRLKSKDKARYGLAQDFVRVRFTVANPDGTNIREMEKSLVLFTELTTQLKKLGETPEAVDPRRYLTRVHNLDLVLVPQSQCLELASVNLFMAITTHSHTIVQMLLIMNL